MVKDGLAPANGRNNALGFVRLILACLVIVSHTPEMIDGNRLREPLTRIFQTISFGEFAVDSFFVISGYLIVASYLHSGTINSYLKKRIARIFPGFAVATIICLFIVAPLAGGSVAYVLNHPTRYIGKIITLQVIDVPNTFSTLPIKQINAAVWTISHEFRCYIVVIFLGVVGLLKRPIVIAIGGLVLYIVFVDMPSQVLRSYGRMLPSYHIWLGELDQTCRLMGIFLIGSLFYLWRSKIRYTWRLAYLAVLGLFASLLFKPTAELGVAIFGGYLIFGFSSWGRGTIFCNINNKNDISYGVYLYGWPIGSLLIFYTHSSNYILLTVLAVAIAILFGWFSWLAIEKPTLRVFARDYGLRSVQLPHIIKRIGRLRHARLR